MEQKYVIDLRDVSVYHSKDSFKEASFKGSFANRDLVLEQVNLQVAPGEMVYLIGRVGSGKSTLLKTLYADLPLHVGEGNVAGFNLRQLKRKQVPYLRRRIGVVFQDYQLLSDRDVLANLYFVLKATGWKADHEIRQRINEVLEQVGLTHKEHKMPFQLSGGEQQRLSIARALLNQPQVLLADEPTGNLDPTAANGIMELFVAISQSGCAVLMSTHNIGNIQQYPSRTLRFNQGMVEEIDIRSILGI